MALEVSRPPQYSAPPVGTAKAPRRFRVEDFDLPYSSKDFREAFELRLQSLRERRSPLSPTSVAWFQQRKKLVEMGEDRAVAALLWSAESKYQALVEPKGILPTTGGRRGAGRDTVTADDELVLWQGQWAPIGDVPFSEREAAREATRAAR